MSELRHHIDQTKTNHTTAKASPTKEKAQNPLSTTTTNDSSSTNQLRSQLNQ
jgi:phage shock protein A